MTETNDIIKSAIDREFLNPSKRRSHYLERISIVNSLKKVRHQVKPGIILDVGCGTGHLIAQVAGLGANTVGVDSDPAMIAAAVQRYPELTWILADIQNPAPDLLPTNEFDAAISNAALHWMPQQEAALKTIRSTLRADAVFVAEMGGVNNVATIDTALRQALEENDVAAPLTTNFYPTVAQEATFLEEAGFRVEEARWFTRPTPLQRGDTPADWVAHFRSQMWKSLPEDSRRRVTEQLLSQADSAGLYRDGVWFIDYCRLRFRATAI